MVEVYLCKPLLHKEKCTRPPDDLKFLVRCSHSYIILTEFMHAFAKFSNLHAEYYFPGTDRRREQQFYEFKAKVGKCVVVCHVRGCVGVCVRARVFIWTGSVYSKKTPWLGFFFRTQRND